MNTFRFTFAVMMVVIGMLLIGASMLAQAQDEPPSDYMGVDDCGDCHRTVARDHAETAHGRALLPADDDGAVLADFAAEDAPFALEDVAWVIGSGQQTQAFLSEDLQPFLAQWNVAEGIWEPLDAHEDSDCIACHTTGYDGVEWVDDGVQCETCHGPGEAHVDAADEASRQPDEEELALIRSAIILRPDAAACGVCHSLGDNPAQEMLQGTLAFGDVPGVPSAHFTAEDGPDCVTCHLPDADESHLMTPDAPQGTCADCHADLSAAYLSDVVTDTQQKTQSRLDAIHVALANDGDTSDWVRDAVTFVERDGSQGFHNYAYVDALLDAVAIEVGLVEVASLPPQMLEVLDPSTCAECHRDEVRNWQNSPHANASLGDVFLNAFADQGRPDYCMGCHASGYDANTGDHQFEGVICTSCHLMSTDTEHPPAPVEVARDSAICGTCHSGAHAPAYDEWLVSDHQTFGVDCVDCHTPHDNGLIRGDVNSTCGDCHSEAMNDEVHMAQDMTCVDCHMTARTTQDGEHVLMASHTMAIDPGVCSDCHGNTHDLTVRETNGDGAPDVEVAALQEQIALAEEEADEDRLSSIVGGALGAIIVMFVLMILFRFRKAL